jgi:hypothetical protein
VEIRVVFVELSYLIDAMENGCMVLSAELTTYFWQAGFSEYLA